MATTAAVRRGLSWFWVEHSLRTAVAAVVSFMVARGVGMPEAYWAPLTTLVVTQSTVRAALGPSGERLAGTALGAAVGAAMAGAWRVMRPATLEPGALAYFAAGVFALGILCALLRLEKSAYRFAGITLTIVLLIPRPTAAWLVAWHRFIEVSVGIAVGLVLTAAWPERTVKD